VVATRKVTIGQGYDKKVVTQIAKEEDRCDVCAIGRFVVTQDGVTKEFTPSFTFGDRLKNGVFDATHDVEVFRFKQQEGSVDGIKTHADVCQQLDTARAALGGEGS
jgi:hypothetical protein